MASERIIFEVNGARFVADTAAGPDQCSRCEMPRHGKTCVWSMVCSNVLAGAVFKREKPAGGHDTAAKAAKAEAMAEIYQGGGYTGD